MNFKGITRELTTLELGDTYSVSAFMRKEDINESSISEVRGTVAQRASPSIKRAINQAGGKYSQHVGQWFTRDGDLVVTLCIVRTE